MLSDTKYNQQGNGLTTVRRTSEAITTLTT